MASSIQGLVVRYGWFSCKCSIRVDPRCIITYGSRRGFLQRCALILFYFPWPHNSLPFVLISINHMIIYLVTLKSVLRS